MKKARDIAEAFTPGITLENEDGLDFTDELERQILLYLESHLKKRSYKWISVEDRTPEPNEMVLIYHSTGFQLSEYSEYERVFYFWDQYGFSFYADVTHWMPLPEPPEQ